MTNSTAIRNLLNHVIGGGWGSEDVDSLNDQKVAIIRGADFPSIQVGDVSTLPIRFEAGKKVKTRRLEPGDIVLEISGGTNERPTGRTVFIDDDLLSKFDIAVIPASFCRLLRPDPNKVDPRYLYYWLQDMFNQGRTWAYQVRSTGIANFQTEFFLDNEIVSLPPIDEQRRISETLGEIDALISVNRVLAQDCDRLAQALVSQSSEQTTLSAFTSWGGLATTKPKGLVDHYSLPAFDNGHQADRVDGHSIKSNKQVIEAPCVLVARLNPHIPRVWMVYPQDGIVSLASTEFVPITSEGSSIEAVYAVCSSPSFLEKMKGLVTGTTGSHQRVDKAALTSVLVPDVRTLSSRTIETISHLVRRAHGTRQEIASLISTRDELIPLLVSGRVQSVREKAA